MLVQRADKGTSQSDILGDPAVYKVFPSDPTFQQVYQVNVRKTMSGLSCEEIYDKVQ